MPRLLPIALAGAVLLGVAACSDNLAPADVAGTWNATSVVFTSVANPSTNSGNLITQGFSLSITLNADGTASVTQDDGSGPSTDNGTYAINGSDFTLTLGTDTSTGTIALSGNTLTVHITTGVTFDFGTGEEAARVDLTLTRA